jgi:serine phosphatase RsbU (regulator of sigma subunit)
MNNSTEPRIHKMLVDDVKNKDLTKSIRRDFNLLTEFMISEEKHARLNKMGGFKRFFVRLYWLLRALIINLTPARRLLLVLALFLFMINDNSGNSVPLPGVLILLFILMLELKDKLLARRELEAGHGVQRGLMPQETPHCRGWDIWLFSRPANEVCGDFVDFLSFNEVRHYAAIGDVSGKGLGAALLGMRLQASLRALASPQENMELLGTRLNAIFIRDSIPGMFASVLYIALDSDSNELHLLNAGHIPPIRIAKDRITKTEKGCAALGLSSSMKYAEQIISVANDELVLLYTDGLTEALNEAGDFIGEEKLLEYLPQLHGLSPKEAGERLIAAVDYFIGDAIRNDDLSIILLRRAE